MAWILAHCSIVGMVSGVRTGWLYHISSQAEKSECWCPTHFVALRFEFRVPTMQWCCPCLLWPSAPQLSLLENILICLRGGFPDDSAFCQQHLTITQLRVIFNTILTSAPLAVRCIYCQSAIYLSKATVNSSLGEF